ncbi:nodulation protein NfeD [Crassaminicella thermophila]|uniref:Nodulation protein NfeD n=1 Tax=Crassaminicella thermophila TaxID=2599308 RepID=A0A5C0SEJ7_CRATE|nr:NfeD family protein [Crassaminicella thermophila]QEK12362.1 nodulation protein NfeD [Crassaminicella thermophila]
MRRCYIKSIILFFIIIFSILSSIYVYAENEKNVYVIPIKGEINPAVTKFVKSAINDAENDPHSVAIIFEIDTLGGMINQATQIRDAIMKTPLCTISFVNNKAESAGVLITIASEHIVMNNGSTIGSAETIPYTEKNISYWKGELRTTSEQRGRESRLIESMADRRIEIKDPNNPDRYITKEGELLNLTTKEAKELGFIDFISNDYDDILNEFDIEYTNIINIKPDFKMMLAQGVTSSVFLPIILSIGFIGLIVEFLTPGFGIGGTIGLIAFTIFFGGSMLAGNANFGIILIFIVGITLLLIEAVAPGFGAPGIGGILCIIVSIIVSSDSIILGVTSLAIAFILTIIVAILLLKYGPKNRYFDKIVLGTELRKEKGFISTKENKFLLGLEGITVTPLRPAGIAVVNDIRIDVVTEGEYIEINTKIKVMKVEGRKIIVKKIS